MRGTILVHDSLVSVTNIQYVVVRMIILASSHRNVRFVKPFNSSIVQIPYAFCTETSSEKGAGVDQVVYILDNSTRVPFGFVGE